MASCRWYSLIQKTTTGCSKGDVLHADNLRHVLKSGKDITLDCRGAVRARHGLTALQIDVILAG